MAPPAPAGPLTRVLLRSALWYVAIGAAWFLVRDHAPASLGAVAGAGFPPADAAVARAGDAEGPAILPTVIAMLVAAATALPVAWLYTHTRHKKGYQQSVVQTLLILPVIVAGIVVLVKHSLPLAFALAGIVAAVRFRTTLDDSKDAANIFVVTGLGLAAAVAPPVAFVLSVGYNLLIAALHATDFGRAPALEGRQAEQKLQRALASANRTGMFVARLDDEVLRDLAPEQLEALADRAWRRRKRHGADAAADERPEFSYLLRVRTRDVDATRAACEAEFDELFSRWKYMGKTKEDEGMKALEYGVTLGETVTPGVVTDALKGKSAAGIIRVELKR
jgi:hypothetical protein